MQTLAQIKSLLESRGLRPKRSLGQNFLIDHNLIRKLASECTAAPGDLVLEVGPGTGTLTEHLLSLGCTVIACELDDALAAMLRERAEQRELEGAERLTVVHHDCLADKRTLAAPLVETVAGRPFKLIANLPYGAATPLVMTLLARHPNCVTLGVTVQRELADRMLAQPGSKDFGPLSVLMHALTSARRIAVAPPECFWPRPDVTSALVVAERLTTPLTADPTGLADFCQSLFSQRRKQIGAVLNKLIGPAGAEALRDLAIAPETRAEELDVHRLIALHARCVHASPRSSSGPA